MSSNKAGVVLGNGMGHPVGARDAGGIAPQVGENGAMLGARRPEEADEWL